MLHSHTIHTIPAENLDALRQRVAETEAEYEAEYPGFECAIEIIESDPNENGRIAFRMNAPDGCGAVGDHDLLGDFSSLDVREEPAVNDVDLANNPYCISDTPFWIESAYAIHWHHVGDMISRKELSCPS